MSKKQLYFIALIPPPELREAVKALKEEMKSRFGAQHALKSPAHLTLQMPFRWKESEEAFLLASLKGFAAQQQPFQINLSGFDCFPPKVIYIRVENHRPIIQLHEQLKVHLIESLGFTPEQVNSRFHPHLTIATRDLRKSSFREAWAEFESRKFTVSFEAESLFLLKHTGRFWEIYRAFIFDR